MTAVAVWDHRPDADGLLAARLADGWRPTPSALRGGPRVLGHASCVFRTAGGEGDATGLSPDGHGQADTIHPADP